MLSGPAHHLLGDVPPILQKRKQSWEERLRLLIEQLPPRTSESCSRPGVCFQEMEVCLMLRDSRLGETLRDVGRPWETLGEFGRLGERLERPPHRLPGTLGVRAVLGSFI